MREKSGKCNNVHSLAQSAELMTLVLAQKKSQTEGRRTSHLAASIIKRKNLEEHPFQEGGGFMWCEPDDHPFFQSTVQYPFHQVSALSTIPNSHPFLQLIPENSDIQHYCIVTETFVMDNKQKNPCLITNNFVIN